MRNKTITIVLIALVVAFGSWFYIKKSGVFVSEEMKKSQPPTFIPVVGVSRSKELDAIYLTDTKGRTLYTNSKDENLKSNCTKDCLKNWPVFEYDNKSAEAFSDPVSKKINVFQRSDGTYKQYAYGNKPLYYYAGDENPGDINGNKLNDGQWNIVVITDLNIAPPTE